MRRRNIKLITVAIRTGIMMLILAGIFGLSGCFGGSEFKIKGNTADGSELTFRIVTYSPDGVKSEVLATRGGYFEYADKAPGKGRSAYVEFYTNDYNLIGVAEVSEGATTNVTIDRKGIKAFKAETENDPNQESFNAIITKWLASVNTVDNVSIEKFIKAHPSSVVSFALLSTLYDASEDSAKAYALLTSIDPEARPGYFNNGFTDLILLEGEAPEKMDKMTGWSNADSLTTLVPAEYKATIVAFTTENKERSDSTVPMLRRLASNIVKGRQLVVEHNLYNDTLSWRRALRDDAKPRSEIIVSEDGEKTVKVNEKASKVNWISIWTGAGVSAPGAAQYPISKTPYYVVADSAARIVYSGFSASAAEKAFKALK